MGHPEEDFKASILYESFKGQGKIFWARNSYEAPRMRKYFI